MHPTAYKVLENVNVSQKRYEKGGLKALKNFQQPPKSV